MSEDLLSKRERVRLESLAQARNLVTATAKTQQEIFALAERIAAWLVANDQSR